MSCLYLSYVVIIIQWIKLCHKNCMTTCIITVWNIHVTSLTISMSTIHFLIEIMSILKAIKYHVNELYVKKNLPFAVISNEIYETRQRLLS